jgi:hypothetical protein
VLRKGGIVVYVLNTAALAILGFLLLRKLIMMERFFAARVWLITAVLCGLLLFGFLNLLVGDDFDCVTSCPGSGEFRLCDAY